MQSKLLLRTAKSWHGSDQTVVFQTSASPFTAALPKKFYLVCDCNQNSRGFRFTNEKPEDLKVQGLAANILRKYMAAAVLLDILEEKSSGNYWALFTSGHGDTPVWYIKIERCLPPELSFISQDCSVLFRISSAGSFSKRRTYTDLLPLPSSEGYTSIREKLLNNLSNPETPLAEQNQNKSQGANENTQITNLPIYQREARDRLARRVKTIRKSLDKLRQQTATVKDIALQKRNALLLQQYSYLVGGHSTELVLTPELTGLAESVIIELDPGISSGQHVNDAFVKIKKMQKSMDIGQKKLSVDERNLALMVSDLDLLRLGSLDQISVEAILRKYRLSAEKQETTRSVSDPTIARPFKEYRSLDDAKILVGKSATESDILVKGSKSNDYWLHIIGTTGSHVIIPFKSLKGGKLAEEVKRAAGILAVHNSKFRTDLAGEVHFTRKQHLRKKKGLAPGMWTVDKSETIYVKYTDEELKKILERHAL